MGIQARLKNRTYNTDKLSDIPVMASAISKKISKYKQQHQQLVEESSEFFATYVDQMRELSSLKKNIAAFEQQIDIIVNYKNEHRKLPQIKGQKSTAKYLQTLYNRSDLYTKQYKTLRETVIRKRTTRYENLDQLADSMVDLLDSRRLFSQFLGTIALSTPLPSEKVRCIRNEKFKPIYVAALVVALFEEVRKNHQFEHPYLRENLDAIFGDGDEQFMGQNHARMSAQGKAQYREEVLKPIAKAALIHSIGSYSPEAEMIFAGDRYRHLDTRQRNALINSMHKKSIDYLKIGIGIPPQRFDSRTEQKAYIEYENKKLKFMLSFLDKNTSQTSELDDLLRIPMVYSSFIVSTKPDYDYRLIYQAYDVIERGVFDNLYNEKFAQLFLAMVGKFPVGSGIYFISKDTGTIERGIVSSLYPEHADEPYCKQITRQQIQSLSQCEVQVSRQSNIYYGDVRVDSEFEKPYYALRYNDEFTWNANELWELQIPALTFWKKDGTVRAN